MAAGMSTNDNFVFVILFFDLGPGSEMLIKQQGNNCILVVRRPLSN